MAKYYVVHGSVKSGKDFVGPGAELELTEEQVESINRDTSPHRPGVVNESTWRAMQAADAAKKSVAAERAKQGQQPPGKEAEKEVVLPPMPPGVMKGPAVEMKPTLPTQPNPHVPDGKGDADGDVGPKMPAVETKPGRLHIRDEKGGPK